MEQRLFPTIGHTGQLVDRAVDEIQQQIVNGQIGPGTKLPPENELADQLGVSRTVIREAVRMLRAKGLVESRQGVGTTVLEPTRAQIVEPLSLLVQIHSGGVTLDQLYQVRTLLEIEIAGLAALNASAEDIELLQQTVDDMRTNEEELDVFAAREADFHQVLAHATQNPLLELLLGVIRDLLEEYLRNVLHQKPHVRAHYVARHCKIIDKVKKGDSEGARAEMQEHLHHVKGTMKSLSDTDV